MKSINLTKKKIESFDSVLIITNHSYIDFNLIANHSSLIIDIEMLCKELKLTLPLLKLRVCHSTT